MRTSLDKDKYLSIVIVLGLILIASNGNKSPLAIFSTIIVYIIIGKVIIKLASIVQTMVSDVRKFLS